MEEWTTKRIKEWIELHGNITFSRDEAQSLVTYIQSLEALIAEKDEVLEKALGWMNTLENIGLQYMTLGKDIEIVEQALADLDK